MGFKSERETGKREEEKSLIHIQDISFQYQSGEKKALDDIRLEVQRGDFLGIIGASGAGKTTLSRIISGIIPHHYQGEYFGSVSVNGLDPFEQVPSRVALEVGCVFQDIDSQMVASVVEDEILFGLENFGVPRGEIESRLETVLAEIGISELRYRSISSLSGGQRQKVAIAAIVALRPEILVLDEPTGELDPVSSRRVFDLLRELNEVHGLTILVIEQKIMLLSEFAKTLAVMENGRILCHDTVRRVLSQPNLLGDAGINIPRTASLSNRLAEMGILKDSHVCANVAEAAALIKPLLPTNVSTHAMDAASTGITVAESKRKTAAEPGRTTAAKASAAIDGDGDVALKFDGVSFGFQTEPSHQNGTQTIRNLTFEVKRGELAAIIGANGAGKSTTARLMNGLLKPNAGTVQIFGMDTAKTKTSQIAKRVGFLFQNPDRQLCCNTVYDEVSFGLTNASEKQGMIQEILSDFALEGSKDPFSLSRGERQRAALASLMVREPELLILDEPTTGLDYRECTQVMEHIRSFNQKGMTVIMICHDMEIVQDYADRVLILNEGTLIADKPGKEALTDTALLNRAALLPPQIPQLAMELGPGFETIFTIEEMAQAIAKRIGTKAIAEKIERS